ncbi:MAG TPA: 3-dehydroquinate synthase [Thermoanaerobaculia bacterium]|nr:3-dehydroquinate synthase [Thermoanaerobaculia bacterium]
MKTEALDSRIDGSIHDEVHLQKFEVSFEYPVVFTEYLFRPANRALLNVVTRREPDKLHRLLFIIDGGLLSGRPALTEEITSYVTHHSDSLSLAGEPLIVTGGEVVKNDASLPWHVQEIVESRGIDRHSFIVAVGGGALLDFAGYAASIAHRGLRLIRIPTTVLSQGDSGIGVKNGINAFGKKNFIGTFAPPFAVINDYDFLETLSRRDVISGIAEAIKVALIRDASFFEWIETRRDVVASDPEILRCLIRKSAGIHMAHIASGGDPFELGTSRPLDFGHWAAHRLEALTHHRLRHGEAVAIGIALDSLYSRQIGALDEVSTRRILNVLQQIGFRLWTDEIDHTGAEGLLRGLHEFREHLGGRLTITMLEAIGRGFDVHEVSTASMSAAIQQLRNIARTAQ